jgi:hypothetical protein
MRMFFSIEALLPSNHQFFLMYSYVVYALMPKPHLTVIVSPVKLTLWTL